MAPSMTHPVEMTTRARPGDVIRLNEAWGSGRRQPGLAGVFLTVREAASDGAVTAETQGSTHRFPFGSYKIVMAAP